MFLFRSVRPSDLKQILQLARMLSGVNLSNTQDELQKQIQTSQASFSGEIRNKKDALYLFCIEDLNTSRIVGTSMIFAQHGSKESPHYFFQLLRLEKFSQTIHSGIVHQVLRLGYDVDGPTEVGGIVLHPDYRHTPEKLGKVLSWGRFMYMAMHRRRFKDRVIAELMPPLTPDGKSLLWEAIGQKFTNLPYIEADKISQKNKEFITSLFPRQDIYVSLLDARTREIIGQVGEESLPARAMLEKIGFKFLSMIDPFDGGPHYGVRMKDITIVKITKPYKFRKAKVRSFKETGLVVKETAGEFMAVFTPYEIVSKCLTLPAEGRDVLKLEIGERSYVLPFPTTKT